ncbi:LysE family transporter [Pseudomonas syringae pv. actinidiae]|nr:LysE family transporter [Pseudomonas syringae pv. actinidiae]
MIALVVTLTPGPAVVMALSNSDEPRPARAMIGSLGNALGLMVVATAVAAGLGAVLAASEMAFTLIKWFGVAYLVYLGIRQWRALPTDLADESAVRPVGKPMTLVLRGFLVNISNPKALIFILAILPQFIEPTAPLFMQYVIIATTMVVVDLIVMAGYTGLASKVLRALKTPRQQRRLNRTFASLFVGAAAFLATLHRGTA